MIYAVLYLNTSGNRDKVIMFSNNALGMGAQALEDVRGKLHPSFSKVPRGYAWSPKTIKSDSYRTIREGIPNSNRKLTGAANLWKKNPDNKPQLLKGKQVRSSAYYTGPDVIYLDSFSAVNTATGKPGQYQVRVTGRYEDIAKFLMFYQFVTGTDEEMRRDANTIIVNYGYTLPLISTTGINQTINYIMQNYDNAAVNFGGFLNMWRTTQQYQSVMNETIQRYSQEMSVLRSEKQQKSSTTKQTVDVNIDTFIKLSKYANKHQASDSQGRPIKKMASAAFTGREKKTLMQKITDAVGTIRKDGKSTMINVSKYANKKSTTVSTAPSDQGKSSLVPIHLGEQDQTYNQVLYTNNLDVVPLVLEDLGVDVSKRANIINSVRGLLGTKASTKNSKSKTEVTVIKFKNQSSMQQSQPQVTLQVQQGQSSVQRPQSPVKQNAGLASLIGGGANIKPGSLLPTNNPASSPVGSQGASSPARSQGASSPVGSTGLPGLGGFVSSGIPGSPNQLGTLGATPTTPSSAIRSMQI